MGHSKAEKTETHKRIVKVASKRFREDGLRMRGIPGSMARGIADRDGASRRLVALPSAPLSLSH